jgi:hypothetical protein
MLDQPREPDDGPDDAKPVWHASGWSPVFVEGEPGVPRARLVGHTRLRLDHIHNGEPVRTLMLSSPSSDHDGAFAMHGAMVMYPYMQSGVLIWAWHLEQSRDQSLIPDFRPTA